MLKLINKRPLTLVALVCIFIMGCDRNSYSNNQRIYIEGYTNLPSITVFVRSGNVIHTKGLTDIYGKFRLGGPKSIEKQELSFNKKIKSAFAGGIQAELTQDSLGIILPENKNYFEFYKIELEL